jgi:hypothetical protein
LIGRQLEPNAAPPNVSAAVAIDADSASAFVIVYGIDELEVALEADAIGGEPFDPEEIALEYLHGLVASRRSAAGPITISITLSRASCAPTAGSTVARRATRRPAASLIAGQGSAMVSGL